jgi:hypothetical protein
VIKGGLGLHTDIFVRDIYDTIVVDAVVFDLVRHFHQFSAAWMLEKVSFVM